MDRDCPSGIEGWFVDNLIPGHGTFDFGIGSAPAQLPGTKEHQVNKDQNQEADGNWDRRGRQFNTPSREGTTLKIRSDTHSNTDLPQTYPASGEYLSPRRREGERGVSGRCRCAAQGLRLRCGWQPLIWTGY